VLGKHYVDSKIRQFDRLKKRRRAGKGFGANPRTGRLFLYVSKTISL